MKRLCSICNLDQIMTFMMWFAKPPFNGFSYIQCQAAGWSTMAWTLAVMLHSRAGEVKHYVSSVHLGESETTTGRLVRAGPPSRLPRLTPLKHLISKTDYIFNSLVCYSSISTCSNWTNNSIHLLHCNHRLKCDWLSNKITIEIFIDDI